MVRRMGDASPVSPAVATPLTLCTSTVNLFELDDSDASVAVAYVQLVVVSVQADPPRVFETEGRRLAGAHELSDEAQVWIEQRQRAVFTVEQRDELVRVDDDVHRRVGLTAAARRSAGPARPAALAQPVHGRASPVHADGDHPPAVGPDAAVTDQGPTRCELDGVPRVADVRVQTDDAQRLSVAGELFQLLSHEARHPDRTDLCYTVVKKR